MPTVEATLFAQLADLVENLEWAVREIQRLRGAVRLAPPTREPYLAPKSPCAPWPVKKERRVYISKTRGTHTFLSRVWLGDNSSNDPSERVPVFVDADRNYWLDIKDEAAFRGWFSNG